MATWQAHIHSLSAPCLNQTQLPVTLQNLMLVLGELLCILQNPSFKSPSSMQPLK